MHYLVCDLEATCWGNNCGKEKTSEIIEIGAVWCDEDFFIYSYFDEFIQPILHKKLSEYCTNLTGIQQSQVDNAPCFPTVLMRFEEWISMCRSMDGCDGNYKFATWGDYDRKMFEKDCRLHNVTTTFTQQHVNFKHLYGKIHHVKPMGLHASITHSNLDFIGRQHSGIVDAINIARLMGHNRGLIK